MSDDSTPETGPSDESINETFFATVEQLRDLEVLTGDDDDAEEEDSGCSHEWEPEHQAMVAATTILEKAYQAAECLADRGNGADCDHVVAGEACPFTEQEIEPLAHLAGCVRCTADAVLAQGWPYAVTQETGAVLSHLLVLRTKAEISGTPGAAEALAEAIVTIANGQHRH